MSSCYSRGPVFQTLYVWSKSLPTPNEVSDEVSDEVSTELSSSEREASEEPPVPPISLRDQSLMLTLLDALAEATDQENPEGPDKDSNSSSEEEANKTVIESKDHIEDDVLNASITHTLHPMIHCLHLPKVTYYLFFSLLCDGQ